MEEALARGVQIFLALSVAYILALWFALAVWAYRDIGARSQSVVTQVVGTLLVVLFSIPGALLYLLLRPKDTLDDAYQRSLEEEYLLQDLEDLPVCHSCQRPVEEEFALCPHCQTMLKEGCPACARLISVKWSICPYCGTNQSDRPAIIREQLPVTEDRFIERGAGTFKPLQSSTIQPAAAGHFNDEQELIGPGYTAPGLEAGLAAAGEPAGEESEPSEPIRLFDRKKTRLLRAAGQSDDGVGANGASSLASNGGEPQIEDEGASAEPERGHSDADGLAESAAEVKRSEGPGEDADSDHARESTETTSDRA